MNRAILTVKVVFYVIRLAGDAIQTAVLIEFDVARIKTGLQQLLYAEFVSRFGGADEIVIRDIQTFPCLLKQGRDGVSEFLWRSASSLCSLLNLETVLICSGEEMHIVAEKAMPPR